MDSTNNIEGQIEEIINRETRAWDTQDADLLMTVWHPDMVFVWPPTPDDHDPVRWSLEWGPSLEGSGPYGVYARGR